MPVNVEVRLVTTPEPYVLGRDSHPQPGPLGRVEGPHVWQSAVFPGTIRQYWIYVPAQYDGTPAALAAFQDGHQYVDRGREYRVPVVFDNLIRRHEMPTTIGLFVNPGHVGRLVPENPWLASNRSFEYDSLGDRYATFLLDEMLPQVRRRYAISDDPEQHAIVGASSGGICAFTVAWERSDRFRKVVSHIGSFTDIRGGHVYPSLIRAEPRRPIRVFLQDGAHDIDNELGSWPRANQEMAAALESSGYDYRFAFGVGAHTHLHGGAILPDTMRWLWRRPDD